MPFICRNPDDTFIHSGRCTDAEWNGLKTVWRVLRLRMACCPAAAIPVELESGTRFFRHHPGEDCGSESESLEHQAVKADAAVAAQAAGWSVAVEGSGTAPGGEKWRADVLCSRGEERVAIEIQMSRQNREEYWRRQAIYAASGVKGVWFAGHKGFERHWSTSELPIFAIRLEGLKADVWFGRNRDPGIPVEQFVGEFLGDRWYCREPIAAPAVIVPELSVCLGCGREVLAGRTMAAYPSEADPAYPTGPIFASVADIDFADDRILRSAWLDHRIIAPLRSGPQCPYCAGRLFAPFHFTPRALCDARHGIQDRHGTVLLVAGGWWPRGEALVPRGWTRPETPPQGAPIPLTAIVARRRDRLPDSLRALRDLREAILSAIRSAIGGRPDWKALLDAQGESTHGDDPGPWIADVILEETVPNGRRIAFFLALDAQARPRCRIYAQRAVGEEPDCEAVLLTPTPGQPSYSNRVLDLPITGGTQPLASVNSEPVTLARFAADLVRGSWVLKTTATVPYSLLPVPASCPSCGRTDIVESFMALHFGEADGVFGNGIVVMPAPRYWAPEGRATPVGSRRSSGMAQSLTCLCGVAMTSSVTADVLLASCGDLQVRNGRWHFPVGPLVRRGTIPFPPNALGQAVGHRTWTLDGWESHIGAVAPPPDSDAVRKRRAAFDSLLRGAKATGWLVDESRVHEGVVLVSNRVSRTVIAVLTTLPGSDQSHRVATEIKAADAVLRGMNADEAFWLSTLPDPPLPRGHERPAILLGWQEDTAFALPALDNPVPLDRFVQDILEGGWEYVGRQIFTLTLVPERLRCTRCGEVAAIAPWCAATSAYRPAPSFARILGRLDGSERLLPLNTAESLRRNAERQLRLPPYQTRDGSVVQACRQCGSVLVPTLSGETLQQRWTGPGVGHLQINVDVHRWCRLGEPILTGSLTVPGRPASRRMTLDQWFAVATSQQSMSF